MTPLHKLHIARFLRILNELCGRKGGWPRFGVLLAFNGRSLVESSKWLKKMWEMWYPTSWYFPSLGPVSPRLTVETFPYVGRISSRDNETFYSDQAQPSMTKGRTNLNQMRWPRRDYTFREDQKLPLSHTNKHGLKTCISAFRNRHAQNSNRFLDEKIWLFEKS